MSSSERTIDWSGFFLLLGEGRLAGLAYEIKTDLKVEGKERTAFNPAF